VVAVYTACGDLEEWLHIEMDQYRSIGEWFVGTDEARDALAELLDASQIEWQRPYDLDAGRSWLEKLEEVHDERAIRHLIGKQIGILREHSVGSEALDWRVLFAWRLAVSGDSPLVIPQRVKGKRNIWQNVWCDRRPDEESAALNARTPKGLEPRGYDYRADLAPVPPFTTDVAAALAVWPDGCRPASWDASAIECCIEALIAQREQRPTLSMSDVRRR
jgi:hypothetical protein